MSHYRQRSPLRACALLVLLVVGTLFGPGTGSVHAGSYAVKACQPGYTTNNALTQATSPTWWTSTPTCTGGFSGLRHGLNGYPNQGENANFQTKALPSGNTFTAWAAGVNQSMVGNMGIFAEVYDFTFTNRWQYTCGANCSSSQSIGGALPNVSGVFFMMACRYVATCGGQGWTEWNWITLTVNDPSNPTLTSVGGSIVSDPSNYVYGGNTWVSGTRTIDFVAYDSSGISLMGYVRSYDGSNVTFPGACDYSFVTPCTGTSAGVPVHPNFSAPGYAIDTTAFPNGCGSNVQPFVWDAGINAAQSTVSFCVDNAAPAAPTSVTDPTWIYNAWGGSPPAWSGASDAHSGIKNYDWCIGTGGNASGCTGVQSSGTTTSTSVSPAVPGSGNYITCVRTRDNLDNVSAYACSNGFGVDTTAPTGPSVVNDGAGADIDLVTTSGAVSINWSGATDGQSGIQNYDWAINDWNGVSVRTGTTSGTSVTSGTMPALADGMYTSYVRARDNVGNLSGWIASDQFRVDTTAPSAPSAVNDGPGADVSVANDTATFQANWSGASDAGSGIQNYDWCINDAANCSTPNRTGSTGSTSFSSTGAPLPQGTYYACVLTRDNAGWTSGYACSNGFTLTPTFTFSVDSASQTLSGGLAPNTNATVSSVLTVQTNAYNGYQVTATDESDTWGADCVCGDTIPDWTGPGSGPTLWPSTTSGYWGITVLSATGGRLGKWTDGINDLYAGLKQSSSTQIHTRGYGTGTDTITTQYRTRVGTTQTAGLYDATIVYTATALP